MSSIPLPPLLDAILCTVDRRYRLPPLERASSLSAAENPATTIAIVMEQARQALAVGQPCDTVLECRFIAALAQLIRDAMDPQSGDPAFQAIVLRHQTASVREYASLSEHAEKDKRTLHSAVNAIAHPAKLERIEQAWQREALGQLHAAAFRASWAEFDSALQRLLATPESAIDSALVRDLSTLRSNPALARLLRLDTLASDEQVRRYRTLLARQGPHSGSARAIAQGVTSRQRGAVVEALAARALTALANRLNAENEPQTYCVVTSLRVPPSLPGHGRAKTEWDVALLERAKGDAPTLAWNVRLLVEAKASADAATTDLPKLLRGLHLLAHADKDTIYSFRTQEGTARLHGGSLSILTTDEASLRREVLYCCDAAAQPAHRMLSAASRMRLLSAQASLDYANVLMRESDADPRSLALVWRALLTEPQWRAVLHQYAVQRQVRELMVNCDDLSAAIEGSGNAGPLADM